jgi:gliding motility-associated-like protein
LETTTYSVAPITGVTAYTWSLPAGWQLLNGQGTAVLTVAAGTSAGTLRVQASNECGEGPAARLEVTPSARVGAPGAITASSPVPCAGEKEIVYAIAPVANAAYYTWTVPADWTITGGQGTPSLTVTTTATAGEVTVKAGNACGESAVSSISAAPVAQVPAAPASMAGNFTPCASQREVTFTIAAVNNAASYLWQVPEGWVITQGQGTASIRVTAGRAAGNISVKALNNCGAGQEMLRAVVPSLSPLATPQDIDGPVTVCAGERVSYSTPEIPDATLYTWQVPATWTILAGQGTTALEVLTGATGGTVGVQTTNSCGNSGVRTAAITVGPGKPAAPALITGTQDICAGTPGLAYHIAAVAGATTYAWTVPAGWIITGGQGTPAITVTAGRAAGYIAVSAANPCGSGPAATLAVNPAWPLPATLGPIAASSAVICQDQGQLVFQVAPLPGEAYYHWQLPAGWVLTGGAGTAAITVNAGKTGGSIRVKASNPCGESGISELPVQPLSFTPLALGTIAGNTIVCAGQPQLSYTVAPAAGAGTYTWTVPAGWLITAGQGTEKITVTAGPQPGSITVVAANSCTQSPPVALPIEKVFPAPPPAINDNSSVCAGLVYSIDKPADLTPANPDKKPSYTWQVPAGWTITQGQGSGRLSVVAPAGSKKGTITVVADNGNCHSAPITLVADPAIAEARLDIANAITANGDGANDTWDIKNLVNYPENEVVVFNRWGNEVYRRKGYHNDWNGGNLNAGTYFYQLKV